MDADQDAGQTPERDPAQPPGRHPDGHGDEVLLDSPEQAAALLAETGGDDEPDGAPWTDGPGHVTGEDLPEPLPASARGGRDADGSDGSDGSGDADGAGDAVLPMSVEGVGDLVADPLSRARVIPRDDPGGPAEDEVPPSPS